MTESGYRRLNDSPGAFELFYSKYLQPIHLSSLFAYLTRIPLIAGLPGRFPRGVRCSRDGHAIGASVSVRYGVRHEEAQGKGITAKLDIFCMIGRGEGFRLVNGGGDPKLRRFFAQENTVRESLGKNRKSADSLNG